VLCECNEEGGGDLGGIVRRRSNFEVITQITKHVSAKSRKSAIVYNAGNLSYKFIFNGLES